MDVRNCRECGRLFNYIGGIKLCPDCIEALEKKFADVKEYIYQNENCGIREVSDAVGVSVAQIKQWVREERLIFSSKAGSVIECELCGAPIVTGKYCQKCKDNMQKQLTSVMDHPTVEKSRKAVRDKDRMRFLDK
ncbi:flagellar protein [Anaerosacchariphilus polymeriproducens]|uniref:Flagellar protein n=1 Tax=Anaerosacchariphilus polymeriproducens TaxID=1812858 RepID=A0A371ARA6_9FIRM|nr:flagellar protein [Anaerosacchariphilus polymeriproducens]RDU22074.1 flagellar protein [Anaerosacchariphilus polymeriproducens]